VHFSSRDAAHICCAVHARGRRECGCDKVRGAALLIGRINLFPKDGSDGEITADSRTGRGVGGAWRKLCPHPLISRIAGFIVLARDRVSARAAQPSSSRFASPSCRQPTGARRRASRRGTHVLHRTPPDQITLYDELRDSPPRRSGGHGMETSMPETTEAQGESYLVVVNAEEQYSIWAAHKELPAGWTPAGTRGQVGDARGVPGVHRGGVDRHAPADAAGPDGGAGPLRLAESQTIPRGDAEEQGPPRLRVPRECRRAEPEKWGRPK